MYTFYFHGHYTTVASVCTAYFPDLRKGKGTKAGEIATAIRKIKNLEKGIDKRGRIWYSNKAVGAVMSRAGKR